jgi:hypothetical protein
MKILKIITEDKELLKQFMTPNMSFDEGVIEVIVGWGLAKEMGASILNHKISDNKYWTFLPREKRKMFEENIKEFVEVGYKKLIEGVSIKNLNPIKYETQEKFLNSIEKAISGGKGYLYSDRLYVYNGRIYHIDMGLLDFMLWDIKDNIIEMVEIIDVNLKDYEEDLKYIDIKYIPYLIDAKKDYISSDVC